MKRNEKVVPARFAPEIGFDVKPHLSDARREDAFRRLRHELLFNRLDEVQGQGYNGRIRRAAFEAEALAWATPFPLLVFPALFEEKASAAADHFERQEEILENSRNLLSV